MSKNTGKKRSLITIEPRGDIVLIRPIRKKMSDSGKIHIPTDARDPLPKSRILAVGPDVTRCAPGDLAVVKIVGEGELVEVVANREVLGLISETFVIAILEGVDISPEEEGLSPLEAKEAQEALRTRAKLEQAQRDAPQVKVN